ncbi:hypothetical protein WA158_002086 [Blastocystis sp. Blastoise]
MAVFDPELLSFILTAFIYLKLNSVFDFPSLLLRKLRVYINPKKGYLYAIYPDQGKDGKKKVNLLKQKQDVYENVYAACDLSHKTVHAHAFSNATFYDYFAGLVFICCCCISTTLVALVRYLFGYTSSHVHYYSYVLLMLYLVYCLISWFTHLSTKKSDFVIFLVFYVFCFVYAIGLLYLPETFFTFNLKNVWTDFNVVLTSIFERFSIHYTVHILPDIYICLFCLLISLLPPLLLIPVFRYTQLESKLKKLSFLISPIVFFLPLYIALSFIKPLLYDILEGKTIMGVTINENEWFYFQCLLLFIYISLRLSLFRPLMQCYFNLSNSVTVKQNIIDQFLEIYEGKRTKEVEPPTFINYIIQYTNVVCIHLLCPPLLLIAIFCIFFEHIDHSIFIEKINDLLASMSYMVPSSLITSHNFLSDIYTNLTSLANNILENHSLVPLSSSTCLNLLQFIIFYLCSTMAFTQFLGRFYWTNRDPASI